MGFKHMGPIQLSFLLYTVVICIVLVVLGSVESYYVSQTAQNFNISELDHNITLIRNNLTVLAVVNIVSGVALIAVIKYIYKFKYSSTQHPLLSFYALVIWVGIVSLIGVCFRIWDMTLRFENGFNLDSSNINIDELGKLTIAEVSMTFILASVPMLVIFGLVINKINSIIKKCRNNKEMMLVGEFETARISDDLTVRNPYLDTIYISQEKKSQYKAMNDDSIVNVDLT